MEKEGPKIDFDDLSFKPLTEGLGFHPFADGMPYAPVSQNLSRGTGAVAAGRPTFVRPRETPLPLSQRPTATQIQARSQGQVHVPVAEAALKRSQEPTLALSRSVPSPAPAPATAVQTEIRYGFLYAIRRVVAYFLDSSLNIGVCGLALTIALDGQDIKPDVLFDPGVIFLSALFFLAFNWAVVTAQEIAFGSSVGKRLMHLQIRGPVSALFLRSFFFLLSVGFFGFGLLWAIFDRRRRCWHDLVVDLQPTPISRL